MAGIIPNLNKEISLKSVLYVYYRIDSKIVDSATGTDIIQRK